MTANKWQSYNSERSFIKINSIELFTIFFSRLYSLTKLPTTKACSYFARTHTPIIPRHYNEPDYITEIPSQICQEICSYYP